MLGLVLAGFDIYDLYPMAGFGRTNLQNFTLRDEVHCVTLLGFESCGPLLPTLLLTGQLR